MYTYKACARGYIEGPIKAPTPSIAIHMLYKLYLEKYKFFDLDISEVQLLEI